MSDKTKRMLKNKIRQIQKTVMETSPNSEMCWLPACKIGRLMVVWSYENGKESRWKD